MCWCLGFGVTWKKIKGFVGLEKIKMQLNNQWVDFTNNLIQFAIIFKDFE